MLQNADLWRRFGMVPACVPVVMDELAIIALKFNVCLLKIFHFIIRKCQLYECGYSFFPRQFYLETVVERRSCFTQDILINS
jgi:hypothetical protein